MPKKVTIEEIKKVCAKHEYRDKHHRRVHDCANCGLMKHICAYLAPHHWNERCLRQVITDRAA
jgi:formate hydrogenlyase subunit 6/NADH:ubiquinone oxidoreductase subunit I